MNMKRIRDAVVAMYLVTALCILAYVACAKPQPPSGPTIQEPEYEYYESLYRADEIEYARQLYGSQPEAYHEDYMIALVLAIGVSMCLSVLIYLDASEDET